MNTSLGELAQLVRNNIGQVDEKYIFRGLNALSGLRAEYGVSAFEQIFCDIAGV